MKTKQIRPTPELRARTGVPGLDDVLVGGLPARRLHLVHGAPGTGKTTLALSFLREGVAQGESVLYVTLSESREELEAVARSHGWSLDGLHVHEVTTDERPAGTAEENTLFHPSEIELSERVNAILEVFERVKPKRVAVDSCSELRLLARDGLRYRRQVLALKNRIARSGSTLMLLDSPPLDTPRDVMLESLSHGVIELQTLAPAFGAERRRMRVSKMRGVRYRGGYHDFVIRTGGIDVFPRLVAAEHHAQISDELISSDNRELDQLLGGGFERGTTALILGPAGSGKSAVTTQYVVSAAERGEKAALFLFDEGMGTLIRRSRSLGMDVESAMRSRMLEARQVDPAELCPGEFVALVREQIERGAKIIVIDSLNGYLQAMPEEGFLTVQLHELLSYVRQKGATAIMVMAQHGMFGGSMVSPVDLTYLADTVVMLRYFEALGAVRKAISVVKKRAGSHETAIRELELSSRGVRVGPPLSEFEGVLTGVPRFTGNRASGGPLLHQDQAVTKRKRA